MFPVLKYSAGKGTEGRVAETVDGQCEKIQKKEDAQPVSSSWGLTGELVREG